MPLSEHEQRLLDQIERALYAEDPKFASNVRGGRLHRPSRRRRIQGAAVFVLGLVLMAVGVAVPVLRPAGVPVVSVVGFLVMFGGAVMIWFAVRGGADGGEAAKPNAGGNGARKNPESRARGSFTERMEERFRKRFDQ
jgi:threonine/homoserine/homoserine lactone efflux protein